MFDKGRPSGGARGGPCEKSELEVVSWHPRYVCGKFGINSVKGRRDIAGQKVSKNVYEKGGPSGGARGAPREKSQLEVVIYAPRSVCAKFGVDSVNGREDIAR